MPFHKASRSGLDPVHISGTRLHFCCFLKAGDCPSVSQEKQKTPYMSAPYGQCMSLFVIILGQFMQFNTPLQQDCTKWKRISSTFKYSVLHGNIHEKNTSTSNRCICDVIQSTFHIAWVFVIGCLVENKYMPGMAEYNFLCYLVFPLFACIIAVYCCRYFGRMDRNKRFFFLKIWSKSKAWISLKEYCLSNRDTFGFKIRLCNAKAI